MSKPTYYYPGFVKDVTLLKTDSKRYWLKLKIHDTNTEGILVILKNPSRADNIYSDKTVYNVSNYIYRNRETYRELNNIGTITILNLMPHYLTDSGKLIELRDSLIDKENFRTLNKLCKNTKKVIIAWGNHPKGLYDEYEHLKKLVMQILAENSNEIFFVDRMTKTGNPKHGQIWAYNNKLKKLR
jgi:hypothetical protein